MIYIDNVIKLLMQKSFFSDGCQSGDRTSCFTKGDYITHFDTLAYSENGVLNAFVKLGFNVEHFRHLGSKNSILIEVYPADPNEYKFLPVHETGGMSQCKLDIENTTFRPFPKCENGQVHDNCHELKTPVHWGLFFTTEFGNVNIMWPTEHDYNKVFELPSIEVLGKPWYLMNKEMAMEKRQLDIMQNFFELCAATS